ncbi:TPA: hypothetical protein MJA68_06530 [Klebsiella pneumoniae]|nr:hypothetical protein [Klebsiella pneumoniae]HBY9805027.1 hypothetical protein [Klebsiella pneumoniae]
MSIANRRRIFRTPGGSCAGDRSQRKKKKRSVIDDNENGFIINTYDTLQAIFKVKITFLLICRKVSL